MFVDEKIVSFKAGDGGDGCLSFRRAKYIPKGGPNGGDGGKGGNIILECDVNINDLTPYHYNPIRKAKNGQPGRGNDKHGANGADCILKMPIGTIISDTETKRRLAELTEHGQRITLIEGGRGGLGNPNFKSSTNRTPIKTTPGIPVPARKFKLVLKVIADVGLIGYPNAGKSSLTKLITNAQPKVAPYPFTTRVPKVAVIDYPEQFDRLTVADIPGIIKGASENRGLGHRFLRHIERCQTLLAIIDMAGIDENHDPVEDYKNLLEELRLYDPSLLNKKLLVASNKMDLPNSLKNLKHFQKNVDVPVYPISCKTKEGIDELKANLLKSIRS